MIYLKDKLSWIDNEGGLVVGLFACESLTPFVSLLTLLNLKEEDIEYYVSDTKFRLFKESLEEKFKKEKMAELTEKDEEPKYIVPNPDYVRQSMEACFKEDGGGIKQLMEKWGDAEKLYGKDSYIVALRDRFRAVYGMIPMSEIREEEDKK